MLEEKGLELGLLQPGMEFASFKELAGWFGITYPLGATNTVANMQKEFKRFFLWDRIPGKWKLIITDVFPAAKPKEKKKVSVSAALVSTGLMKASKTPKYSSLAGSITNKGILDYIKSLEGTDHEIMKIIITKRELWNNAGISVTPTPDITEATLDFLDSTYVTPKIYLRSWNDMQSMLSTTLKNVLVVLQNNGLLDYYKGDLINTVDGWILPTIEEQRLLNDAKANALKYLQLLSPKHALLSGKFRNYVVTTLSLLAPQLTIRSFTPAYQIVFQPFTLQNFIIENLGFVPTEEQTKEHLLFILLEALYKSDSKKWSKTPGSLFDEQRIAPELKEVCYKHYLF